MKSNNLISLLINIIKISFLSLFIFLIFILFIIIIFSCIEYIINGFSDEIYGLDLV